MGVTVHDAILLADDGERCVDANESACRILGLAREELLGRRIGELVEPGTDFSSLWACLLLEGELHAELAVVRSDGVRQPVELSAIARILPGRHLAILRDVSEQRLAREALRQSEERFSIVFHKSPIAISITTRDGRFLEVNESYMALMGYERDELVGRAVADVGIWVDASERTRLAQVMEARRGGIRGVPCQWHAKSGETRWVELSVEPTSLGGTACYLTLVNDVTERHRAEEALRQTTDTLAAVYDTSPAAIMVLDMEGRVTLWSPAAEHIFGWKAAETLGGPVPHVPEEDLPFVMQLLKSGESVRGRSVWRQRKDGSTVEVLLSTAPLRDGSGHRSGSVGILLDMSEQRKLEQQLLEAQKMEAIGRLAGGVAHDFNNMLAAITGFADIIESDLPMGDPIREDLGQIKKAADRATALTRQLLAFGRRQVLQLQVLEPALLVSELEPMLRRLIGEDVQLVTELADGGCVKADPGQLEQVILNLVVNARDAMPSGGHLSIQVERQSEPVLAPQEGAAAAKGYVVLSVTDTGTGMSQEVIDHVFEPFFTTKAKGKGTGLGLSTVYGIVKQTGGFLRVESELGSGSEFRVYLPICDEEPGAAVARATHGGSFDGTETILVVEDEELVRTLACHILRRYGYEVLPASNGGEALLLCERHDGPIDLLLTDVMLPHSTGPEVAKRLRGIRAELQVVYMSGYSDETLTRDGSLDGVLVQKPFSAETLLMQVRQALDRKPRATRR